MRTETWRGAEKRVETEGGSRTVLLESIKDLFDSVHIFMFASKPAGLLGGHISFLALLLLDD
jgi:hypothetical protein